MPAPSFASSMSGYMPGRITRDGSTGTNADCSRFGGFIIPPRWCGYGICPSKLDDDGVRPDDDDLCDGDDAEFVACMNCSIRDDRDMEIEPRSSPAPSVGISCSADVYKSEITKKSKNVTKHFVISDGKQSFVYSATQ